MADLASLLERFTGQPVFDRTSLSGLYLFTIELPPRNTLRESFLRRGGNVSPNLRAELDRPSIDMASEAFKGLGLRLEKRRSDVDTIVVDRIERTPTDN